MEEVFMYRSGKQIAPLLATDDGVRLRVAPTRWNKGDLYGPLGVFFTMLKLEQHKELWHYDTDSNRVITWVRRRILVLEGIRRDPLQLARKGKPQDGQEEEMDLAFHGNVFTWPLHTSCLAKALTSRDEHLGLP